MLIEARNYSAEPFHGLRGTKPHEPHNDPEKLRRHLEMQMASTRRPWAVAKGDLRTPEGQQNAQPKKLADRSSFERARQSLCMQPYVQENILYFCQVLYIWGCSILVYVMLVYIAECTDTRPVCRRKLDSNRRAQGHLAPHPR